MYDADFKDSLSPLTLIANPLANVNLDLPLDFKKPCGLGGRRDRGAGRPRGLGAWTLWLVPRP